MFSCLASFVFLALPTLFEFVNTQTTTLNCPILGPDFPTPKNLSTSAIISNADASLLKLLNDFSSTLSENIFFSISLFSVDEDELILQYHHSPSILSGNSSGVHTADADSIYRIGSCSKLLSVYTFLIEAGDIYFNDAITKYVPELVVAVRQSSNSTEESDAIDKTSWDQITIGNLASHMAGVTRDATFPDIGVDVGVTALGLPVLDLSEIPDCGAFVLGKPPCVRAAFFKYLLQRHPIFHASATPAYSNTAFQLLAYALEKITNKSFAEMLSNELFVPLNMTHSSYSQPADTSFGVIPFNESASGWSAPTGDEAPSGGYYSSTNDLARAGRSILASSLLSPAQTRRWLKPVTHTSYPYLSIGHPWEIIRVPSPNNGMTDLYTKDGDIGLYHASLILSPDHNMGFTVLVAGDETSLAASEPPGSRDTLKNALIDTLLPAVEGEARQQASNRFAGTYAADNNTSKCSFTIATDDRPGLGLFNGTAINGTPLQTIAESQGIGGRNQTLSVRLYPTGLKATAPTTDGTEGTYTSRMSFRATFESVPQGGGPGWCGLWTSLDGVHYGGIGIDEFIFAFAEGGEVMSVEWSALRTNLVKKS